MCVFVCVWESILKLITGALSPVHFYNILASADIEKLHTERQNKSYDSSVVL